MFIVHDKRIPGDYTRSLKKQMPGAELIPFECPGGEAYSSIYSHPDIYLFRAAKDILVHSPGINKDLIYILADSGIDLIQGQGVPGNMYPKTAIYNAVRIGGMIFHNFDITDKSIIDLSEKCHLKRVDISQGYARCSVLACSDSSLITSDAGIKIKAEAEGLHVLLAAPGHIELPGEKYGFIGGTGGLTPEGTLVILGDLASHPGKSRLEGFIKKNCAGLIQVKGLPLYDGGGLFFF